MEDQPSIPEVPSDQTDWEALARYLAGESDGVESGAVRTWLSQRPRSAEFVAALDRAMQRAASTVPAGLDVGEALARVRRRMREPEVVPVTRRVERSQRRRAVDLPRVAVGLAAAIVFAAGIALWRERGHSVPPSRPVSAERVFTTRVGERDTTTLPDGSIVLLGPGSRLAISAGFAEGHRSVELVGDAHFEVKHDSLHAFAVRALGAVISDVGTTFVVHADRGDGVLVSVSAGAVRVKGVDSVASSGDVQLNAGDLAVVGATGAITLQRGGASSEDTEWIRGRLVFRDAPLAKVRADLRRWYGVELLSTDSSFAHRHVTASFGNDSRQQVLKVISLALGASFEMRGDTVLLHASAPTARPHR